MTMNDKEIMGMCKKLAYRYNSEAHREDMMQEGILVCYEVLAEEPDAHPAKLYRAAKSRMHDYLNIDRRQNTLKTLFSGSRMCCRQIRRLTMTTSLRQTWTKHRSMKTVSITSMSVLWHCATLLDRSGT